MKINQWFQIILSKSEDGLWYDHDDRQYDNHGWGFVLKFRSGDIIRPYTRFKYWFKLVPNKWNNFNSNVHGLIQFKSIIPLPFLSISMGRFGLYIGFKESEFNTDKYIPMLGRAQVYKGSKALILSATIRRTRWK